MSKAKSIPDLTPFDHAAAITLRQACNLGLVTAGKGDRLNHQQLQRWATRGFRPIPGTDAYLFPTIKTGRERLTCRAWCEAWCQWVGKVRAAAVRSQVETWERCKRAASG